MLIRPFLFFYNRMVIGKYRERTVQIEEAFESHFIRKLLNVTEYFFLSLLA